MWNSLKTRRAMTENEAKTKWCPMVNRAGDRGNRTADGVTMGRCVASGCMMWRTTLHGTEGKVYEGYCGLAGKP